MTTEILLGDVQAPEGEYGSSLYGLCAGARYVFPPAQLEAGLVGLYDFPLGLYLFGSICFTRSANLIPFSRKNALRLTCNRPVSDRHGRSIAMGTLGVDFWVFAPAEEGFYGICGGQERPTSPFMYIPGIPVNALLCEAPFSEATWYLARVGSLEKLT